MPNKRIHLCVRYIDKGNYSLPAGVLGLQIVTELKRPPIGSVLLVTAFVVVTEGASVALLEAITFVGLLVMVVVLLVTVVIGSELDGFAKAAEKMPNGAVEADVATLVVAVLEGSDFGTAAAVPPKPRDEPSPPKLNGELEVFPTVPPVPVNPPNPKDLFSVSAFGFWGTFDSSVSGGTALNSLLSAAFCSLGLVGSGVGFSTADNGFGFGVGAATAGDPVPNESADLAAPPPKLKLEIVLPPKMDKPGFAASPGVTVFVVGVTVDVFTNGMLWLKENGVATGVVGCVGTPGFSTTDGIDGIGLGSGGATVTVACGMGATAGVGATSGGGGGATAAWVYLLAVAGLAAALLICSALRFVSKITSDLSPTRSGRWGQITLIFCS